LRRLAGKGVLHAIITLGNRDLIGGTGIPTVDELDWWQSVRLSEEVTVTVVPAQHFSSRTPWDRNKTLWGGFVISGPSGNIFYSGDTGYGPHFRVAILPISPFSPSNSNGPLHRQYSQNHMGPVEAVQAHLDLRAGLSIAAHFQVFQLGADGFDDALNGLRTALAKHGLQSDAFIAPPPGRPVALTGFDRMNGLANLPPTGAN
jgi:L-ascorbate metabolism protein UlaG (beta-lactamase superfamily)